MKNVFKIILAISIFSNLGFSQEEPIAVKSNIVELNPLLAIIGMYSGSYGMVRDNGANEIAFPFFYMDYTSDDTGDGISSVSIGARYRIYKNSNGKGFFYGPFVGVNKITITLSTTTYDENWVATETQEEASGMTYKAGCDIGYRWMWDSGFTLAPSIGLKYSMGSVETTSGETSEEVESGIGTQLGIGVGWAF